jgi:hypothetical protein
MNKKFIAVLLAVACCSVFVTVSAHCCWPNYFRKYEMERFSFDGRWYLVANKLPEHCKLVQTAYAHDEGEFRQWVVAQINRKSSMGEFYFEQFADARQLSSFEVDDSSGSSEVEGYRDRYYEVRAPFAFAVNNIQASSFGDQVNINLQSCAVKGIWVEVSVIAVDYSGMEHKFALQSTSPKQEEQEDEYSYRKYYEQELIKFQSTIYNAKQYEKFYVVVDDHRGHRLIKQEVPVQRSTFEVYPTAFTNKLVIDNTATADAFSLVSQYGRVMYGAPLTENVSNVEVPNLAPGMYMLCLYRKGELLGSKKLVRING